jgi:transposase-like protein
VSHIWCGLDEQVKDFLSQPLGHAHFTYVYIEAIYLHALLG